MKTGNEQIAEFVRRIAGRRGEQRRAAIAEAVQISREGQPVERPPDSQTPRTFARDATSLVAAPSSLVDTAAAAALGADRMPPVLRRRAGLTAPWHTRLQAARHARLAALGGTGIALVIAAVVALLIAGSAPDDRPTPTAAYLLHVGGALSRAARVAAAAARPPAPPASASGQAASSPARSPAPEPSKPAELQGRAPR